MGRDFAAAVQLHSVVSEELAGLLVRNRSARTPRGGDPDNRADEIWGPGSWHQRLLASMLGGDPLANPDRSPWPRPDEDLLPPEGGDSDLVFDIPGPAPASGQAGGWDWPDRNRAPFVSTSIREPQVLELFRLASRFHRLALVLTRKPSMIGGGHTCTGVDLAESSRHLYEWVEAELRRASCYDEDGDPSTVPCCSDECGPVQKPAHPFPDETYLLWERFRIQPQHADTLVRYLADNLDYEKLGLQPRVGTGDYQLIWCDPRPDLYDPDYRPGAQSIIGRVWFSLEAGNSAGCTMHLTARPEDDGAMGVAFLDRTLRDIAPAYTRNAVLRFHAPWELAVLGIAREQGFIGSCLPLPNDPGCLERSQDAKRLMGATAALAATRFMLMSSLGSLNSGNLPSEEPRLDDYFAHAKDILSIVGGGIGAESVGLRPVAVLTGFTVGIPYQGGEPVWEVDVTFGSDDSFWQEDSGPYSVCAIAHPAAANLALSPVSRFGDLTIASLVDDAVAANRCATGSFWSETDHFAAMLESHEDAPRGWSSWNLRLPSAQGEAFSLVAFRDVTSNDETTRQYELLGASFFINDTQQLPQGHFVATGGTLGGLVARAIQGRPENPTQPRYDGFGLPTDWVPPFTAELLGGTSEQASADRYLSLARSTADEATAAVNDAMETLMQEQQDEAAMSAATQRWQQGMKEETEKLCGPDSDCDVLPPTLRQLDEAWFQNLPVFGSLAAPTPEECAADKVTCREACPVGCIGSSGEPNPVDECESECLLDCVHNQGKPDAECGHYCDALCNGGCEDCYQDCDRAELQCNADGTVAELGRYVAHLLSLVLSTEVPLAQEVLETIDNPAPPAFEEFAGGSLQAALIAQSRALRALDERFLVLKSTYEAARARVFAANASLILADDMAAMQCNPGRFARALQSGLSVGCSGNSSHEFDPSGGYHVEGRTCSKSFSRGPYNAQKNACEEAVAAFPQAEAAAVASFSDAVAALAGATQGLVDAQSALLTSGAEIAKLLNEARLAKSRHSLEKKLAQEGSLATSFGLYRRYRSYDVWRAKALVENARRYALAARRSIEARYVVDLSGISQPEAFVQSPATWADEVYGYDLSLPAAVGLSVGTAKEDGIYPNKVRDYVGNLESFVMGYAANRPAAVASREIEVVNLEGLKAGEPIELPLDGGTIYADMGEWTLHCPEGSPVGEGWVPIPRSRPASMACVGDVMVDDLTPTRPDLARMQFALDPWGRLNDHIANEPYARRFNGRWDLMAVNFAGTGIKDCDEASDPYACYSEGFIRYSLSHVGPAWVTDYDGIWRSLGVPIGRIEGAKALASELWLDPLKDGWNTSYISAVARTELRLRPLGGAYELEFVITPEIDIDRIERVQLLIGSTYWVKQD